jgi:hypothetical protein
MTTENVDTSFNFQEQRLKIAQIQWFQLMRKKTMPDYRHKEVTDSREREQAQFQEELQTIDELGAETLRENTNWGDDSSVKSEKHTRVYVVNVNGF